jgi:hypothetical protein
MKVVYKRTYINLYFLTCDRVYTCQKAIFLHLVAFAKLRNATISFVFSVRPLVRLFRIEQLSFHLLYFHEIWYLSIFLTYAEKIQVSLNSEKNNGYFTRRPTHICDRISLILLRQKNVLDIVLDKVETHILFSIMFFFNGAV